MPIPQSQPTRLRVFALVVFGLLLTSQLSFGYRHGSRLVPSDSKVNFGNLQVGKTATLPEVLTNTGSYSITVSSAALSGSGFRLSAPGFPLVLGPGASVTLQVTFAPSSGTGYSGTLAVTSTRHGRVLNIALAGTGSGSGSAAVAPASLSFGNVAVGSSLSKTASLKSTGVSTVISSITTTNPEFTVSGPTLPLTLSPGQNVAFTVKFAPQSAGAASASLSFASTGASTLTQSLSGTGSATTAPADHSVTLSWQDSDSEVAGYNVYRGTTSGGPYTKVNSSVDKNNAYTDASVAGGRNYFYVVSSVDSAGAQSGYSSEVMAIVPTP